MQNPTTKIVFDLVRSLSLEIDMFYENSDFPKIAEPLASLAAGATFLSGEGSSLPEVYEHLLGRLKSIH